MGGNFWMLIDITGQMLFGVTAIFLAVLGGIWAFFSSAIEKRIQTHVDSLDKKREETSNATNEAIREIKRAQETLDELQDTEKELNKKLKDFRCEIDEETKRYDLFKTNLDSTTLKFEERITDETSVLEQKINLLKLIINASDKKGKIRGQIVDKLILDLNNNDEKIKFNAVELLPQFEIKSSEITKAFIEILKNVPDTAFGSLLLNGLGEQGGSGETLDYLLEAVDDLSNPNILAIIGALGEIGKSGESSATKIKDTELDSIIKKLLSILNDDLDTKEFSDNTISASEAASKVRGAIALALSCYGDKARKAAVIKCLITLLMDQEPETRKNAAIALGTIGARDKDVIRALEKLKIDEYIEVSEAASEAIEKIRKNGSSSVTYSSTNKSLFINAFPASVK
jgi:HEAT repeat protein